MFPCGYLDDEMPNYGFEIGRYYLMLRCRSTLRSIQVQSNRKRHTAAQIQRYRRYKDIFDSTVRLYYP
jgi:hypothetical protein